MVNREDGRRMSGWGRVNTGSRELAMVWNGGYGPDEGSEQDDGSGEST